MDPSTVNAFELPVCGSYKQVPEFLDCDRLHNPSQLPADVFYIENAIQEISLVSLTLHLESILPIHLTPRFPYSSAIEMHS